MCVITLTKRDGTPFNVTSIQEEDIMEICVWLGHTHPLGVLHYTTSESIILFQSADEMQLATCRSIKAMGLHKEAIVISHCHYCPFHNPCQGLYDSGGMGTSQNPISMLRGGNLIHPLATPIQLGELHVIFKQSLVTSLTMNCISSWRISTQEVALCKLNAFPRSPPPTPWGNPTRGRDPNVGDQEVTFPRGEGGIPWDNQPHLLPPHDQMEDGFLRDHLLNPQHLLSLLEMWRA